MGDRAVRYKGSSPAGRAELGKPDNKGSALPAENVRHVRGLGHDVRLAHLAFSRALGERLAFHGITPTQWTALRALWEEDGYSQVVLAQRISVAKASLTGVLDGLKRMGLVRRSRSKEDGRSYNVHLTKKGKSLEKKLIPLMEEINAMASRDVSDEEMRLFLRILWKMAGNLS